MTKLIFCISLLILSSLSAQGASAFIMEGEGQSLARFSSEAASGVIQSARRDAIRKADVECHAQDRTESHRESPFTEEVKVSPDMVTHFFAQAKSTAEFTCKD